MVFHQEKFALVEYPRYPHVLFQVQVGVEVKDSVILRVLFQDVYSVARLMRVLG